MTSNAQSEVIDEPDASRIPPPVDGGTEHLESLGRFVDNLMGVGRVHARVRAELEPMLLKEDEVPADPPSS